MGLESIPITPLDDWVRARIGLGRDASLTREKLQGYHLAQLQKVIDYTKSRSPFYRRRLGDLSGSDLGTLSDISLFPFTTQSDLAAEPHQFLCVSQSEIARVTTLQSSGTTGQTKRIFHTASDIEQTVDFFHHGMSTLVKPGSRVLICLPGPHPASVGDLLAQGLSRMNVRGIVHGFVKEPDEAIREILDQAVDCVVGVPVQVLSLIRGRQTVEVPVGIIKSVLLSTDYVPKALVRAITAAWGCTVFAHYGQTEMGFGGGVECRAMAGCHLREADLFFEIIDPDSGSPVSDGRMGEVVFTTLTRSGMPLIRYRSGDIARFIFEPCPCGTVLKRLDYVQGRLVGRISMGKSGILTLSQMDEAIFSLPEVADYRAELTSEKERSRLSVMVCPSAGMTGLKQVRESVTRALMGLPVIEKALALDELILGSVEISENEWPTVSAAKRTILDKRSSASLETRRKPP